MQLVSTLAAQGYASGRSAISPADGNHRPFLSDAATAFAATLRDADAAAVGAMQGTTDAHALVSALTQAEFAVETAVTLRNKVVEAYQEILRMPV